MFKQNTSKLKLEVFCAAGERLKLGQEFVVFAPTQQYHIIKCHIC